MPFGIEGNVKRVGETRYPTRVREVALNQERADDRERLAQLEDHVRRQKRQPPRDSVELKASPPSRPAGNEAASPEAKPPAKKPAPDEGKHLDITL